MSKTKEELNTLKQEYEALTAKLQELTDDELRTITGGYDASDIEKLNQKAAYECNYIKK